MRLVCKDVQLAIDAAADTLVLHLDDAICNGPIDAAMVQFHEGLPGANKLFVHVTYNPTASMHTAVSYLAAYIQLCNMSRLKQFHISVAAACEFQSEPMEILLQAMPGVTDIRFHAANLYYALYAPGMVTHAVANYCQHLRTLAIDCEVHSSDLPLLSSLPHLECLCVRSLSGPGVSLPSVHTLRGTINVHWREGTSYDPCCWSRVTIPALGLFPNLHSLDKIGISLMGDHADLLPQLPSIAERFANSTWSLFLYLDVYTPATLMQHLQPVSLRALQTLDVGTSTADVMAQNLPCVIAAAPQVRTVSIYIHDTLTDQLDLHPVLECLQHAMHLRTLWLMVSAYDYTKLEVLEAATDYLTQPLVQAQGVTRRCPSIQRICMISADGEWPRELQVQVHPLQM